MQFHLNGFRPGDPEIREKFVDRRNAWLEILTSKSFYTFDFHLLNKPESAWAGVTGGGGGGSAHRRA